MKKSIQIAYNELFETKCMCAHEAGFEYIAINYTEVLDKSEYEWEKITENIGEILEKNNLKPVQSHPYYYDLRVSSEITEERYEFAIKQSIISSGKLGAEWCVFHPRSSVSTGFRASDALRDNRKAFSEYLELAVKYDTGIAAENLPVFAGIVPIMPFYSSNYEDLSVLVDSFNDKSMGICWDTGHANLMNFDQGDAIRFLGGRIKCTHIHNNFSRQDNHLTPDSGDIKWDEVMTAFKSVGFEGPFTLETHCCYPDTELLRSFAKHNYACLEYLEKLYK